MITELQQQFAFLGAKPTFDSPLPVGQLNDPDWDRFQEKFRGIFERGYYTNYGPMQEELEAKLGAFFGVKHVIGVTNATIGLIIAAKALELRGKVIVPSYTFIATPQSLSWAGLEPVFCDVDLQTHQLSPQHVKSLISPDVTGILGVHLWGHPCYPKELEKIAQENNLKLYFDSAHAFGCTFNNKKIGQFGALEIFSFHATKILNAAEGGCICTNDDELASRLRNIRSGYGIDRVMKVPITGNGRMSEAQAALALLSLEDYDKNQRRNQVTFDLFRESLKDIPGIQLVEPPANEVSNYQYVVARVNKNVFGLNRDQLVSILKAENILSRRYFYPGAHRHPSYMERYPQFIETLPNTDELCDSILQLPSGRRIDAEKVMQICSIIRKTQKYASVIQKSL